MKEHHITSDIHLAMMPKPTGVASLIEAELDRLDTTHNMIRPIKRTYKDLPDMTPTGPVTIHHIGDFV